MRWLLAGLLFALSVALAIGTAAIRADNARWRRGIALAIADIEDRIGELRRLSLAKLEDASPQQLAAAHWQHLAAEARARLESLQ